MRVPLSDAAGKLLPPRLHARAMPFLDVAETVLNGSDAHAMAQRMAALAFLIRVGGAAIAYISQIFLARWLGGFEYGVFVVVWTWVVILGAIVHLGFATSVIRLIPEYEATGRFAELRGLLFGSRIISVLSATAIVAAGALGVFLFEDFISNHFVLPIYLALVCLPLFTLTEVQGGISRSFNWTDIALSPIYIWRPLLILAFALAIPASGHEMTAANVCLAAIAATYVTAILQWVFLDRRLSGAVAPGPRRFEVIDWFRISLPILLVDGFFVLLTGVDIVVLGQFRPPEEVAVYFAATKTLALVHFVYYAVRAATAHHYSKFYHSGDQDGLSRFVTESIKWTFWPSLACSLVLLFAGEFLLSFFGEGFDAGYAVLPILVVGILARAALGPVESLLTMADRQNAAAVVYGATLVANIVLCFVLIPPFGIYGAAAGTTIALVGESIALFFVARRALGLHVFVLGRGDTRTAETPAE